MTALRPFGTPGAARRKTWRHITAHYICSHTKLLQAEAVLVFSALNTGIIGWQSLIKNS